MTGFLQVAQGTPCYEFLNEERVAADYLIRCSDPIVGPDALYSGPPSARSEVMVAWSTGGQTK